MVLTSFIICRKLVCLFCLLALLTLFAFAFAMLKMDSRARHMLGKLSTVELCF